MLKKLYKLIFLIIVLGFAGCLSTEKKEEARNVGSIFIAVDKYEMKSGNNEEIKITNLIVKDQNGTEWAEKVSEAVHYYQYNGTDTKYTPPFKADVEGNYKLYCKIGGIKSNEVSITVKKPASESDDVAFVKNWLTFDVIKLNNDLATNITGSLKLWITDNQNKSSTIKWSRIIGNGDGDINCETGAVTRGEKDTSVVLTAQIMKGSASDTKTFQIVIKKKAEVQDAEDVETAATLLTFSTIKLNNDIESNITSKLTLPAIGSQGTTLEWSVDKTGFINLYTGEVTRGETDNNIVLTAKIMKGILTLYN